MINTTLQSLSLGGVKVQSVEGGTTGGIANSQHKQAGNWIGAEGERTLHELQKLRPDLRISF